MSEKVTAQNIDEIIEKNKKIESEIKSFALNFAKKNKDNIHSPSLWGMNILKNYENPLVLLPIDDDYFSGAIYIRGSKKIPVLNTSLPRGNVFFTAWHEIYHLFNDSEIIENEHSIYNDSFIEERKAELFASIMIFCEEHLSEFYLNLKDNDDFLHRTYTCMDSFQTTYKSVLIKLYEEACSLSNENLKKFVKNNFDRDTSNIKAEFEKYNIDTSIVEPSNVCNVEALKNKIQEAASEEYAASYHSDNLEYLDSITESFKN